MKLLTFTQQDGSEVTINADEIQEVKEYPAGQCWVTMKNGSYYQLQNDVEQVTRLWKESQS